MRQAFKRVMLVESILDIRRNCAARLQRKRLVDVISAGSWKDFDKRFWGWMNALDLLVFGPTEIDVDRPIEDIIKRVRSAGYRGIILICASNADTDARRLNAGGSNTEVVDLLKMIDTARTKLGLPRENIPLTIRTSQDAREYAEV